MKLLHLAADAASERIFIPKMRTALRELGELEVIEGTADWPEAERAARIRQADVLLTGWGCAWVPVELAAAPGQLKYICHVTGEMRRMIPLEIVESDIPVTNWGNAQADFVAERTMMLLLGCLKEIHRRVMLVRDGGWRLDESWFGGSVRGLRIGLYGLGFIARRVLELLRPFHPEVFAFDPYATDLPDGCTRVDSLAELCQTSQALLVLCGLTPETRGSLDAEHLALLPDNGLVINTARGGIIDQPALFAELERGRLRAGLDVLDPDRLPDDHPARSWQNVVFTCHQGLHDWPTPGEPPNTIQPMHEICLDNLRRFAAGEPLRFLMDPERYERST